MSCSSEGDELQSGVKILFFCIVKLSESPLAVHPPLPPLQIRFKTVSKPFLRIGEKWDLQGSHLGGRKGVGRNMLRHEMEIYFMNYIT